MCHPDLRYVGQCTRAKYSCPGSNVDCNDREFFDPNGTGIAGTNMFRNNIIAPDIFYRCTQRSSYGANEAKRGATPGEKAVCIMSSLTNDAFVQYPLDPFGVCYTIECKENYLVVNVGDLKVECRSEGQEITLPGTKYLNGKLVCPNIKSACAAQKITYPDFEMLMSDSTPKPKTPTEIIPSGIHTKAQVEETKQDQDQPPDNNNEPTSPEKAHEEKKSNKTVAIVASVVVLLVVLLIVVVVVVVVKKNKYKNDSDIGIGDLQV